ncbi:MAG: signal peptidase I, partial [Prolixibacteraceae bacterium]|nr:signal peptidase I [Prolixibacteraceae bacterium]
WIKQPYKRLKGFTSIKNDDVVVFHFPEGDTVALNMPTQSYYQLIMLEGREEVVQNKRRFGEIISRPVDKCENYIKRCVGIPGDEIYMEDGQLFVNGKPQKEISGMQHNYRIITNGTPINPKALDRLNIAKADQFNHTSQQYILPLTAENRDKIEAFANVVSVNSFVEDPGTWDRLIFPSDDRYRWNLDNWGPIKIPKKGEAMQLTADNLPLYQRAIKSYEGNELEVKGNQIYINGEIATSYTFKMDYYWMMGDNRHNSADSRYWGFVPEDHVVGKAKFIWLSLDKDKSFPKNIRFGRLFNTIR